MIDYTTLVSQEDWEFARWVNSLFSRMDNHKINYDYYHDRLHKLCRFESQDDSGYHKRWYGVNVSIKNNMKKR